MIYPSDTELESPDESIANAPDYCPCCGDALTYDEQLQDEPVCEECREL